MYKYYQVAQGTYEALNDMAATFIDTNKNIFCTQNINNYYF